MAPGPATAPLFAPGTLRAARSKYVSIPALLPIGPRTAKAVIPAVTVGSPTRHLILDCTHLRSKERSAGHARDELGRFTSDSRVNVDISKTRRRARTASRQHRAPKSLLRRRRRIRCVSRHSGSISARNNCGPRLAGAALRLWGACAAAALAASHRPLAALSSSARTSAAVRAARLHFGA